MNKTLAPSVTVTARDPKGLKFLSIVEAAYNKAGLSLDEAQRVNEASGLGDLVNGFLEEHRCLEEYKDEEVASTYGYFSGYKPKNIREQVKHLIELFPGLNDANQDLLAQIEKGEAGLPANAEGWFAIPNWRKFPEIFGSTYSGAVQTVLDKIEQTHDGMFHNYRKDQIDEKHLRQSAKSEEFWKNLAEAQGNPDILLVPAQFGIRHRGRSVRRARVVMGEQGVGLGAFAGACMLLTHPERLQHYNDLWIDLAGDEFDDPDSDVRFDRSPYLSFGGGKVRFDTSYVDDADDGCGTASVFVPQSGPCSSNP